MKKAEEQLVQEAKAALQQCLAAVPSLEVRSCSGGPDFEVVLNTPAGRRSLLVELKTSGQPQTARLACLSLLRAAGRRKAAIPVFMAPFISPEGARVCAEEGVACADLAGNCRIAFDDVFIRSEGKANPFARRRTLRAPFRPKAARILRVLLSAPRRVWTLSGLAAEAGVSIGHASNVRDALLDREFVDSDRAGLKLVKPAELLAQWAEEYSLEGEELVQCYSSTGVADLERVLTAACPPDGAAMAFTGFSAAARMAPFVQYRRAHAYFSGDVDDLLGRTGLKRVESGANAILVVPRDSGVFYGSERIDGCPVVSPVQAYLDLLGLKDRGEEAARFLLETVLEKRWQS